MTKVEESASTNQVYTAKTDKPGKNIFQKLKGLIFGKEKVEDKSQTKPSAKETLEKFKELDESIMNDVFNFKRELTQKEREKLSQIAHDKLLEVQIAEKNDAIPDLKKAAKMKFEQKEFEKEFSNNNEYEKLYADYEPQDIEKYQKTMQTILKSKNLVDKSRAEGICKMVCKLSEDYGVDPEITARILDIESGGFQFTPKVMKNPKRSYKGVMQVHKDNIRTMYADPKDANNPKLSRHEQALAYDHKHFEKDQKRIDELKAKYPTPDDLYEAIQNDVSLGLEVGIMTYKSKLSVCKGNTRSALASYCGNQYQLPKDSTATERIYPIPEYSA